MAEPATFKARQELHLGWLQHLAAEAGKEPLIASQEQDRSWTVAGTPGAVLIVEDEAIIAWELADSVERLGYRVIGPALTAAQALHLAREGRPDLIFMDVKLGSRDGVDTALAIAAELKVKIVFCTAYASDQTTLDRMFAAGAQDVLAKPIHPEAVAELLARILPLA